ncbi:transposase [Methylotetracoccus oryzae]|uniref:transposase n=1 Tax=Methylotetracoccus oryzae TaxID=1919059 RepID=UPI0013A59971|nr:transposase [Methylotetracoccus oryzae]
MQLDYPAIAMRAKAEVAEICCGDEIALSSVEHYPRGYAPRGKTPVQVLSRAKCEPINLISAITLTHLGLMRFMLYRETMAAEVLIRFMRRFIEDAQRKVLLILCNLRVHQSRAVKMWLVGAPRADRGVLFAQPLLRAERRRISAVAPEEVISHQ